jgi:hypothetical protein
MLANFADSDGVCAADLGGSQLTHRTCSKLLGMVLLMALVASACGDTVNTTRRAVSEDTTGVTTTEMTAETTQETTPATPAATAVAPTAATFPPGGGINASLTRDDVDCSEEGVGSDFETEFLAAHFVVDGNLGGLCLGEEDPTLIRAWELLAAITPGGQLNDLALFGGFIEGAEGDEVTLAFVNALDDDGSIYQMSVNLDAADEDPNEFQLTMAHEFSHVFTGLPSELDRFAGPDSCATYYNGEGCYTEDSLMAEWVATFWGDGLINEIDPEAAPSGEQGQERCDLNPGFFGAYAASNPEEDFAEAFSAFVFRLPVDSADLQAKMEWFARQPGLVEFQDRAWAAGLGPLANNFDPCGEAS